MELILNEDFDAPRMDPRLAWLNPPGRWSVDPDRSVLAVWPDARTDFWRKTHYGFEADNGHGLLTSVSGDFVMTTDVHFRPAHRYDQAGLLVRVSASCWLKTSVEFEPEGPSRLGAVATNHGYSDWSTQDFPAGRDRVGLRVRREGSDYIVEHSSDGEQWSQLRVAHLHEDLDGGIVACGLYACSPIGAGFLAEFSFLRVESGRLDER